MAVMDEFREEREALKNGTFKQKMAYFWCYYKWHVIITVAAAAIIASFIYEFVTQKDSAFYGVFLNSFVMDDSGEYLQGFAEAAGIDTNEFDIGIDNSLFISKEGMDQNTVASVQKLMVYIAAAEIDVVASDTETFEQYANNNNFADLRDVLSPQQIEKYEPYFYYVDQKAIAEKDAANDANDLDYVPNYPDPTKPEEMQQPVPVAIYIDSSNPLFEHYQFSKSPVVIGVVVNTPRPETATAFIDYIFSQE